MKALSSWPAVIGNVEAVRDGVARLDNPDKPLRIHVAPSALAYERAGR